MSNSSILSVLFVAMSLLLSLVNGRRRLNQWAKEEENNFDDEGENHGYYGYNNYKNGGDVIQVSANAVYFIGGLIVILLIINVSCLCYSNCFMNNQETRKRRNKYSKVAQYATSDDDMQNLKN